MPATVTDFAEYKRLHPPIVRLMVASTRCWWNWALLPWGLARQWLK